MKEAGRYSIATPNSLATRGIPFLWSPIPDRHNSARILRFPPTQITGRKPGGTDRFRGHKQDQAIATHEGADQRLELTTVRTELEGIASLLSLRMGEIQEDDDSRRGRLPIKGLLQRILELESIPRHMEGQDSDQGKSQPPSGASSHERSETKGKPALTLKNGSLRPAHLEG